MNRPKAIGTAGETGVVRVARAAGFPHAERRALAGSLDLGDVLFSPGFIGEVKAGQAAKTASLGQIDQWLNETERERANARADLAILIVQRKGYAPARADWWDCWIRLQDVVWLTDSTARVHPTVGLGAVNMRFGHVLALARLGGFGDPLPVTA